MEDFEDIIFIDLDDFEEEDELESETSKDELPREPPLKAVHAFRISKKWTDNVAIIFMMILD